MQLCHRKGGAMPNFTSRSVSLSRRSILGSAAVMIAAPAVAQECRLGPPEHHKGPNVFLEYDQLELDAAYDQSYYEPLGGQTYARLVSNSEAVRARIGQPKQVAYGTPGFQRQNREFAAALKTAGKPVQLIEAKNYTHSAMCESFGHPYGPAGRAALAMMKLAPA